MKTQIFSVGHLFSCRYVNTSLFPQLIESYECLLIDRISTLNFESMANSKKVQKTTKVPN